MEMSKRRGSLDRLSELPDSLVLNILSLLPMRDVVKTTLLSKRFKDLWTTVPCLNFKSHAKDTNSSDEDLDEHGISRYHNTRFQNFVNRALILWRGTKILEFKVVMFYYESSPFSDLDVWLRIALKNKVEKLYVNLLVEWLPFEDVEFAEYCPLQRLYSCSFIRELHLAGCKLKINGNVQWDQLKYLKIDGVSLSEHVMNQILSGSPQLEVLSLYLAEDYGGLTIHSSSLKALKIEKFNYERIHNVLTIWAPNVETLEFLGSPYGNYVMKNVSSLTNATIDVDDGGGGYYFHGCVLLEDIIRKAYESNRHVERVTLSYQCIKMLGEMKKYEKLMFEALSNAKFLKLYDCEFDGLMGHLESFPKLTKLVLEPRPQRYDRIYQIHWGIKDPSITKFDTDNSLESQTHSPKSCLLHLTTVEIKWSILNNNPWSKFNESIFLFVEFLLKNAIKLEKMVLRAKDRRLVKPKTLLSVSAKLLKIPRSSPTAEVIFVQ